MGCYVEEVSEAEARAGHAGVIFAPMIIVGLVCNAIYCIVKIYDDCKNGQAAFGVVGLVGLIAATGLSTVALFTVLLTSDGKIS
jgi:hypothetical protein